MIHLLSILQNHLHSALQPAYESRSAPIDQSEKGQRAWSPKHSRNVVGLPKQPKASALGLTYQRLAGLALGAAALLGSLLGCQAAAGAESIAQFFPNTDAGENAFLGAPYPAELVGGGVLHHQQHFWMYGMGGIFTDQLGLSSSTNLQRFSPVQYQSLVQSQQSIANMSGQPEDTYWLNAGCAFVPATFERPKILWNHQNENFVLATVAIDADYVKHGIALFSAPPPITTHGLQWQLTRCYEKLSGSKVSDVTLTADNDTAYLTLSEKYLPYGAGYGLRMYRLDANWTQLEHASGAAPTPVAQSGYSLLIPQLGGGNFEAPALFYAAAAQKWFVLGSHLDPQDTNGAWAPNINLYSSGVTPPAALSNFQEYMLLRGIPVKGQLSAPLTAAYQPTSQPGYPWNYNSQTTYVFDLGHDRFVYMSDIWCLKSDKCGLWGVNNTVNRWSPLQVKGTQLKLAPPQPWWANMSAQGNVWGKDWGLGTGPS